VNDAVYKTLRVTIDGGVAFVTIDNPPINLLDVDMFDDLDRLGISLQEDERVRVAVFQSANTEFFIAHADLTMLQTLPRVRVPKGHEITRHQAIVERFRTMSKVTIGKVQGIARGGGTEFLLALDMRFAALGRAIFAQPEVALGFPPGCGGTQRLPRLLGRGRALEAILGCGDYPADLAERYGWINRALPPSQLEDFVDNLAYRIASFPPEGVAAAKAAVSASESSMYEGLCEERHRFNWAFSTSAAEHRVKKALLCGFQTAESEREDLSQLLSKLGGPPIASNGHSSSEE
jgi:enoyl-CoA hydratase/carnithine racemase